MIIAKLLLSSIFVLAWLRSRRSRSVEVSDFFVLSFLTIYIPGFLFHPSGETTLNALDLPDAAARRGEVGMMVVLALGAMTLTVRRYLEQKVPLLRVSGARISSTRLSNALGLGSLAVAVICFSFLLLNPEFRDFKQNVLKFFTFRLAGNVYRTLRNMGYEDSWLIEGAIGRARYTIFPILFCLTLYPLLAARRLVVAVIVACALFILLPASLSKLPIFLFAGYAALLFMSRFPRSLDMTWVSLMAIVAVSLVVTTLILLYVAQYKESVATGAVQPLNFAIERLWGETYSIVVRYFAVYPEVLPYTGWDGINLVAKLIGGRPRYPDIEVAQTLLGPDSGSNPGAFFLGGYAAFGMPGLCIFAVLGPLILGGLDIVGRKIRTAPLHATYFAVIGMNTLFLNQIALQTALVTYGLAVIPVIIFVMDRTIIWTWYRRAAPANEVSKVDQANGA